MNHNEDVKQNRRQFMKLFGAGSLFCLGCGHLCAMGALGQDKTAEPPAHKFLDEAKMSYTDVFNFAYQGVSSIMKIMAEKMGKEKFLELLKDSASESSALGTKQFAKSLPKNDLASYVQVMKQPDSFWKHVLTFDILEDKENVFAIKVKECLWAKTFRKVNADDIGYAMICHTDFAAASAFNPKLKMTRTKTLMQGHEYCDHCLTMEP